MMPICMNPECGKEIPQGMNYCGEGCLRRHVELNQQNRSDIAGIIKYLDLGLENLNVGTKNKQKLMERALSYMKDWKTGTYNDWINRLSLRLNVTVRTVRENYLDPLISEGIIRKVGSQVDFVGLPQKGVQ